MSSFDFESFRAQFPILNTQVNNRELVYFDNAATTQKPSCVIDQIQYYNVNFNANVHRSSHTLSAKSSQLFERSRIMAQNFINARSTKEVIWTKGTTEAINLIAQTWGRVNLKEGDEIVIGESEHHANIVPWQLIANETGAIIKTLAIDSSGLIDNKIIADVITKKTAIVCCNHISNVIGKINPIESIIARAKLVGAVSLIDGAQAVNHMTIDVQALDCDFYVFSVHKMYGPTGLGVLYGKEKLLDNMPPYHGGGEMIKKVSFQQTTFNELPFKFEAGTPNVSAVIALASTITFINNYSLAVLSWYENKLINTMYEQLSAIKEIEFIVEGQPDIAIFSFIVKGHNNHDVAAFLDSYGVACRSGHHCAMPLMEKLHIDGCVRLSLSAYNTIAEIEYCIGLIKQLVNVKESHEEIIANNSELSSNELNEESIKELFNKASSWDGKHREIMLLSKKLNILEPMYRHDGGLIQGCESQAWISARKLTSGNFTFSGYSHAKVIRGLMQVVIAAFEGKSSAQILSFDIESYFTSLGLIQHLSPSRGNGVRAIVERIYAIVQ